MMAWETKIPVALVFSFIDDRRRQTLFAFFLHKEPHLDIFPLELTENSSV